MSLNSIPPGKGKLLLAEPMLKEDYFHRSVVLIAEHNEDGSIGFIINKQVNLKLSEAISGFEEIDLPLFIGGPVQKDSLFFVHTLGNLVEDSQQIMNGLYWGGSFSTVTYLLKNGLANEHNIRFFIGYSGWDKGQLNQEIEDNSWVVSKANPSLVLRPDYHNLWREVLRSMDSKSAILSFYPENIRLN